MPFLGLQVSCTSVAINAQRSSERKLQANDPLTGAGLLARTTFRATAVAAVRQPITTVMLGLVNLWHRPREIVSANIPMDLGPQVVLAETPGSWQFERMLDRADFPRAESGSLKWLIDGEGFFPELDRQIAAAQHMIDFQIFIFDNDDIAVRYADILKRKADQLPVRVLYDDLGSTFAHTSGPLTLGPRGFVPPPDIRAYLKQNSAVHVRRILNPWFVCDHTKLLVFDHRTAIIGGMNIGREYYSEWHDLMVRVEGPIVNTLARDFRKSWRRAGPLGDFARLSPPAIFRRTPPVSSQGIPLRLLRTDPAEGRYEILDATLLAIRGAKRRIWIQTPYFAHDDIALAVATAADRGVDVRVILPASGDSAIMDSGNLSTSNGLIRSGAKVYRYPKMTHMKVMICDDWACVGSANLDTLSMRINRELSLAFAGRAEIQELERMIFLPDFRKSKRIRLAETQTLASGIAETIADQL